jgi:tetratricopeptide (TPR) repeat protein
MADPAGKRAPDVPAATRRLSLVLAAAIAVLSAVPFLPALRGGYLDFDDHGFLLESDGWRGLGAENLAWMFSTMRLGHYQPLTYLSYGIEYTLFGLNPAAHHATNILLHAANAVLLFMLARRVLALTTRVTPVLGTFAAAACAAIWGVHPLRAESVAWITERRDVLSTTFLLLAALAYFRSARPGDAALGSPRWYWASVLLLLLSLLAKAWGITFIAAILVLDVYPLRRLRPAPAGLLSRDDRRVLAQKVPFAVLCIAFAAIAFRSTQAAGNTLSTWGIPERLAQSCYGLVFYIWKTQAPTNLSALYELPRRIDWSESRWWISGVIVLAATIAVLALRRRAPGLAAAVVLYAVLVSPVLGITQAGIQLVADRYTYIATMPLLIAAAGGVAAALGWRPLRTRRVAAGAAAGLAVVLGAITWYSSTRWTSDISLWTSALENGHDGPILRNYYGRALEKAQRPADAIQQYRVSIDANPSYADSWFGIGTASRTLGDYATAEEALRKAAEFDPDPTKAHLTLGLMYVMNMDRLPDAITAFKKAVDACEAVGNPRKTGRAYLMLAAAYGESGNDAEAVAWLHEAARWQDTRAEALEHLRELGVQPLTP